MFSFLAFKCFSGLYAHSEHFFLLPFTLPNLQIENRKIDLNVASKVGSLDNVKHRPGGGDKKVFNDVEYLKQMNETTGATLMAKSSGQTSQSSSRRESAVQVRFFFNKRNCIFCLTKLFVLMVFPLTNTPVKISRSLASTLGNFPL